MSDGSNPVRLGRAEVSPVLFTALQTGTVLARADVAVLELQGPGAVTCVQGLLTNDVEKPGDGAFVYGALLTPKGMIVADGWASRLGTTVSLTLPAAGREQALAILARSIPPRLARTRDRTADAAVFRIAGPQTLAKAQAAGFAPPSHPGHCARVTVGATACEVARPGEAAPYALQITAPADSAGAVAQRLVTAGAFPAESGALECARILAGWPKLGAEIDDKTIPQEVRFEELGGLSYTKGCYTGQETVSRLHFRGHANRQLRGLLFDGDPAEERGDVLHLDRDVGRVTSVAWIPEPRVAGGGRWVGLAIVRREVPPGAVVRAAGRDARVVELPFVLPFTAPA